MNIFPKEMSSKTFKYLPQGAPSFSVASPFHVHTSRIWGFQSLYIIANTYISFFYFCLLIMAILVDMKWYSSVVFINISIWLMVLNIFQCACWPFVYLRWSIIYPNPLLMYELGYLSLVFSCKCSLYVIYTNPHIST